MADNASAEPQRRVALVTGGNQGIGESIAKALASAGAIVFVAGRSAERNGDVAEKLNAEGGEAYGLVLDVCDSESIATALSQAETIAGAPIDWLVNNAGTAISAPLVRTGDEMFLRQMNVNFHGARRCAAGLLPGMLERAYGRVINIASSAGLRGYGYVAAYCASKHALVGYTRAAGEECGPKGVGFAAVCPHYVDTPMLGAAVEDVMQKTGKTRAETLAFFASENPGGRLVSPSEVAALVLELCQGDGDGIWELDGSDGATRVVV
jgi:NAD(P)-dependent dehydrogenase (short-subunit alcohol dehydrogenase family)